MYMKPLDVQNGGRLKVTKMRPETGADCKVAWKLAIAVLLISLVALACSSSKPTVIEESPTIEAGTSLSWDVSEFRECRYHFTVRQTGSFGDVDIKFQGRKYIEKDGVFYGDTFILDNGYSLSTAKVVDVKLECDSE